MLLVALNILTVSGARFGDKSNQGFINRLVNMTGGKTSLDKITHGRAYSSPKLVMRNVLKPSRPGKTEKMGKTSSDIVHALVLCSAQHEKQIKCGKHK